MKKHVSVIFCLMVASLTSQVYSKSLWRKIKKAKRKLDQGVDYLQRPWTLFSKNKKRKSLTSEEKLTLLVARRKNLPMYKGDLSSLTKSPQDTKILVREFAEQLILKGLFGIKKEQRKDTKTSLTLLRDEVDAILKELADLLEETKQGDLRIKIEKEYTKAVVHKNKIVTLIELLHTL